MMYCDSSIVAINCLCHLGIVLIGNCGLKCIKYFINAVYTIYHGLCKCTRNYQGFIQDFLFGGGGGRN